MHQHYSTNESQWQGLSGEYHPVRDELRGFRSQRGLTVWAGSRTRSLPARVTMHIEEAGRIRF